MISFSLILLFYIFLVLPGFAIYQKGEGDIQTTKEAETVVPTLAL